MKCRITDRYFDANPGEIFRIARIYFLSKFVPMGNLGGFTRLPQLLKLIVVHRLGDVIFRLLVPHEEALTKLYRKLKRS